MFNYIVRLFPYILAELQNIVIAEVGLSELHVTDICLHLPFRKLVLC